MLFMAKPRSTGGSSASTAASLFRASLNAVEEADRQSTVGQSARIAATIFVFHVAAMTLAGDSATGERQRGHTPCEEAPILELFHCAAGFGTGMNRNTLELRHR
jgi:hypothetical protein